MRAICKTAVFFAVATMLALSLPATAPAAEAGKKLEQTMETLPPVQLKHWQNSTEGERYSFLIGLFSMIDIERAWQGKRALPISQSTAGTWARGLSGVTLRDVAQAVDEYARDHPAEADRPVIEVIGKIYVRPKLTDAEKKAAAARYKKMQSEWKSQ